MIPKPENARYEVAVVGLGYVGIPLALAFARAGCRTLGLDSDAGRVLELQQGHSPLTHLASERIARAAADGHLEFTGDNTRLSESQAVIICVPTPLRKHQDPDLSHILAAGGEIGPHLRKGMLVSLESSTYPGTTREELRAVLEKASGLEAGRDFALVFSPEREDPGNSKSVLGDMPKVIGGLTPACLERGLELYGRVVKQMIPVSNCDTAEAVKLTENIFRFANIALVNELKRIFGLMGIDIWEVIEAAKTKPFGYMPFYPGPGVGGHCIPIDPYYLTWKVREYNTDTRFIELAGQINRSMPYYVVNHLLEAMNAAGRSLRGTRVLVLGVAYKPGVSDDRESPAYAIMDLLRGKGADVQYYDPHVPRIAPGHNHWAGRHSIPWSEHELRGFDAAVVCTAHRDVDYAKLAGTVPLIVDACNVVPKDKKARVVAA
ncbi:MAG: nucleotide sugar dehydrogenase [Chthoniobacterales bacterium]|nr:nucleotide sugar dehydrogenase [Chthoniobacterales bacterium]